MTISAPRAPFDVVFLDFDGTLVRSAALKREAFFAVFPDTPGHRAAVESVLAADPDGSRHAVVPRMLDAMRADGLALPRGPEPGPYVEAYGEAALAAVAACEEMPGAEALLRALGARAHRVVFSATPQGALEDLIARRGWTELIEEAHGHPARKPDTIRRVLGRLGVAPGRAAVAGDGVSDEAAARETGCAFFPVREPEGLESLVEALGVEDVC